ncbi:MAG: MTH938/NDUFAF3 family protein [Candidatus Portnoybacteria bacterium]|nr:MTH938/NDUFAF3 family protein [Candidatus Portnoybacteria bacterium]
MPHIDSTKFGEIIIDDIKYHQVLIIGDKVEERDTDKLKELFDTSHIIGDWEVQELLKENPQITGQNGAMEVDENFSNEINKKGIEVIIAKTPEAIEAYNEKTRNRKRVNALIHTTC